MKKPLFAIAIFALLICFSGCTETAAPHDDTENSSQPESSVSRQESSLPENSEPSFLASEESQTAAAPESTKPEQTQDSAQSQPEPQRPITSAPEQKKPSASSQTAASQPEKPVSHQPEETPEPTVPSKPPVSESSGTSDPPAEPETPAFDVSVYVQFAKDYGTSEKVGLVLDNTATACWDDPITANAGCRYLERDLKDRLDWYRQSGFTAFWVWAEQTGEGEYLIYIGYA